jgi:hypothetical protein
MKSYELELTSIQEMLRGFVRTKTIDIKKLSIMDALIKKSEQDQFVILNSSFPFEIQSSMFGAIRNINTAIRGMKARLVTASERHENPTTAEQALDIIENLSNVASFIDPFASEKKIVAESDEIARVSRTLYRKAKSFGFSEDLETQLKEAGITEKEVKSFIKKFDNNVSQELDIDEEVKPATENNS